MTVEAQTTQRLGQSPAKSLAEGALKGPAPLPLQVGDFVRVRADHDERPGQDGMVVKVFQDGVLGMIFGYDRYNQPSGRPCEGIEEWRVDEFDLSTVER